MDLNYRKSHNITGTRIATRTTRICRVPKTNKPISVTESPFDNASLTVSKSPRSFYNLLGLVESQNFLIYFFHAALCNPESEAEDHLQYEQPSALLQMHFHP